MALRTYAPKDASWDTEVNHIQVERDLSLRNQGISDKIIYHVYRNGSYIGQVVSTKSQSSIQFRTRITSWSMFVGPDAQNLRELSTRTPKQAWAVEKLIDESN